MNIREYNNETDYDGLRRCVISVQDYERELEPRMPRGTDIIEDYIPDLFRRCKAHKGKIFVADAGGTVAGYVSILTKVTSEDIDDGGMEFGRIDDLVVLEQFRGQGYGRALLSAAETEARAKGVKWLRIGVLNANRIAKDLYLSKGFSPHTIELEKSLM